MEAKDTTTPPIGGQNPNPSSPIMKRSFCETFLRLMGYVFFFGGLFFCIVYTILSISYVGEEKCQGPAFFEPNDPNYGTGRGKCMIRYTVTSTLRKKPLMVWYTCYQGDFLEGKKNGSGQFVKWSSMNQFNHPPYEGENKVQFDGIFRNELRQGLGIFSFYDGTTFRGTYNNGSLTCSDGHLEIRKELFAISESTPLCFQGAFFYDGPLKAGLMDGIGNLSCQLRSGQTSVIRGHIKQGVLTKIDSFRLHDGTEITVEKLVDNAQGSSHTTTMELSASGNKYRWDGYSLKSDQSSWNSKSKDSMERNLFITLEGLYQFESHFLSQAEVQENYNFDTFDHILKSRFIPIVKEEL